MKSKMEFYEAYFYELNKKGFTVKEPCSPDYIADIGLKNKIIAYYVKENDTIIKNPFIDVDDKYIEKLYTIAHTVAGTCGICSEKPYEDDKVKKIGKNAVIINEQNNAVLGCKYNHLFKYVFATYLKNPENESPVETRYFYNKEKAFQDFAVRSGLVDERRIFNDDELKIIHSALIQLCKNDKNLNTDELKTLTNLTDRIEESVEELIKPRGFNFNNILKPLNFNFER